MYRTVREGDASLQYTILPQRDNKDNMTLRHAVKRRGSRSSCCVCGPWGLRSRPLLLLGAVLALGCCAVLVAALLPALASASDLEAALQNAFTLGGAGQTASINPNVHHPASRRRDDDQHRPPRPARPARPFSEEDDVEEGADDDDYPSGGQQVAMVSAPELPPPPPLPPFNSPVVRSLPTAPPPFRAAAKAHDDQDDDEDDDDDNDNDLSSESRSIEAAARRMHDGRQSAVPAVPLSQPNAPGPGLPPSLLPQRQPPAPPAAPAPAGLMLDPMMLGDAPMRGQRGQRGHRKTNNGLYTNEDDLDHNIPDLQPQRAAGPAHARASTRIFVEALLPSLPGQGEPEPPQRRSWTPSASLFHWTDWQQPGVRRLALAVGAVTGLCLCVGVLVLVRRRSSARTRRPCQDPPALRHEVHALHSGTRTTVRRESRGDVALDGDLGTTQDLLASSEEEA